MLTRNQILKFDTGSQVTRDINRLDSLDEVRINGVSGRFQFLQDPSQSTKILAVVPISTEPKSLEKEVTEVNKKRTPKISFLFEPFAVLVDVVQLRRLADDIRVEAGHMVYSSTPAEFIKYIKKIYDLALKYEATNHDANTRANIRVMEWLRHIEYNSFKFQMLVTDVDDGWISSVKRTVSRGDMIDYVSDPLYPVNIKVSHFGYSMNGVMHSGVEHDVKYFNHGDVAGWAGDWMTFYGDWRRDNIMPGSKYCHDTLARPGETSHFKLRDMIEDVDAFNIASALLANPTRTIVQEVDDLFKPGGGCKTRFSRFFKARFSDSAQTAREVASTVLTNGDLMVIAGREGLIHGIAPKAPLPSSIKPAELGDFCQGFADVLTGLAQRENGANTPTTNPP